MEPIIYDEELVARFTPSPTPEALEAIGESRLEFLHVAQTLIVDVTNPSREQSAALTALEEAKYWTNQALAKGGVKK